MNVAIADPSRRILVTGVCAIVAALLCYFAIRNALAAHYQGMDTREGYEHAVKLEPADARNWFLLGRSYLYDFEQPNPAKAIEAFRKAVALDPYSAEAMLDLAIAYEGEGDHARARDAYLSAQRVYPLSADVCWSFGNFLLRQGEQDAAFAQLHKAVELDPKRASPAFMVALRAQANAANQLDRVVPASAAVYLPIIQTLIDEKQMEAATIVWERLIARQERAPLHDMAQYVDAVTRWKGPEASSRAWNQATAIMLNPPPPDPPGSLIWDGSFESAYNGIGYGWRFNPSGKDVRISFTQAEKHSGKQSVLILFDGRRNLDFSEVCHDFAPAPGRQYMLSAWVKTEALTSSQGIRLQIEAFVPSARNQFSYTEDVRGTQDWKRIQLAWTAPAGITFGRVCARRGMSDMPGSNIQGAAWIDDVELTARSEEPSQP